MNLQENIRRILKEVRVPRSERVELYRDNNIIVVVPLTHRALQKYAHQCQWCINDDLDEWEDYHKGKHAVIIQRKPKKPKIGITGNPTASEIFLLAKWDNNQSSFEDVCQMLDYEFRNDRTMSDYYVTISNDINNFATNIVYYSPETGIYDQEDNFLWNFNIEINDIPNVKPKVIEIMDDYLEENEEMSIQESIRRILREELDNLLNKLKPYLIEGKYLYHYTPTYNLDDIEEEGLIPRKNPNSFYENGIEGIFLTNKSSLYGANLPQDLIDLMDEYYENDEEDEKPIVRLTIDITQLNPNKITWDDDYIMNLYKWNKARTDEDKIIESIDIWGAIAYKGLIPPELIINHDFDYQS